MFTPCPTHRMLHRLRTMASCLWLYVAPHSPLHRGGSYRFELSATLSFPRCRRFQVSPPRPALSPAPQQPSCAANVTLSRYVPLFGLVQISSLTRSPGHFLPGAVSRSPNIPRVMRPREQIGSKGRIALPSTRRNRTSPIRGMRLQRQLLAPESL